MCLAVPAKIIELHEETAKVDYGGLIREANVSLVSPKVGDYVIVHAGYAIQVLDPEEAKKTIETWNEFLSFQEKLEEQEKA